MIPFTKCDTCGTVTGRLFQIDGKKLCAFCYMRRRGVVERRHLECAVCASFISSDAVAAYVVIDKVFKPGGYAADIKVPVCLACYLDTIQFGAHFVYDKSMGVVTTDSLAAHYEYVNKADHLKWIAVELPKKATCIKCHRILPEGAIAGKYLVNMWSNMENICIDCLTNTSYTFNDYVLFTCPICNTHSFFDTDYVAIHLHQSPVEITNICEICYAKYENEFYYCEGCGEPFVEPLDEGSGYCAYCLNEEVTHYTDEVLLSYSDQPLLIFNDNGEEPKRYYGIELELDSFSNLPRVEFLKQYGASGDTWIVKGDSSLSNGIEIVTSPCSFDYHKETFPWNDFLTCANDCGLCDMPSCGIHIHVNIDTIGVKEDKKLIGKLEKVKLDIFVNRFKNECQRIARRTYNEHCASKELKPYISLGDSGATSRYCAVNFTNKKTVEFRMFASTLEKKDVITSLEFVRSLLEFINLTNVTELLTGEHCWTKYKEFVKNASYCYYLQKVIN